MRETFSTRIGVWATWLYKMVKTQQINIYEVLYVNFTFKEKNHNGMLAEVFRETCTVVCNLL